MSAFDDHADTAKDQLRLVEQCGDTVGDMQATFRAGAVVHALLAVGEAVRQAGMDEATADAFLDALSAASIPVVQ